MCFVLSIRLASPDQLISDGQLLQRQTYAILREEKMESIQIDHKTVINTIKLKPNPRRPGDFRTGTVKERPGGYNAAGDRCYVGLKTSLARCRKSPLDL